MLRMERQAGVRYWLVGDCTESEVSALVNMTLKKSLNPMTFGARV